MGEDAWFHVTRTRSNLFHWPIRPTKGWEGKIRGRPSSIVPEIGPHSSQIHNPKSNWRSLERYETVSVESRNFPRGMRPRKRKLAPLSLSQPLFSFLDGWPSSLDEFRGPTSRLDDEEGHGGGSGGGGGEVWKLSVSWLPSNRLRVSRGSGINGDNAS